MPERDQVNKEAASGLWRSETMVLLALHMQREAAHDTILNLGRMGNVQFKDLNAHVSSFQRLFTNDVRRCEDSERRIRFFEDQLKKSKRIPNTEYPDSTKETLDTLEPRLENWEAELRDLNSRYEELVNQRNSSLEFKEVLDKDPSFFRGEQLLSAPSPNQPLNADGDSEGGPGFRLGGLRYLTGVINDDKYNLFERLVFRATRGNMFMRSSDCGDNVFTDPVTRKPIRKKVFVVFFSAQRAHDKIKKLCESQSATVYPYNIDSPAEVRDMQNKVNDTLENLNRVIQATEKVRDELLQKIEGELYAWKITVITEKSVYNILNMLSFKGQTVLAECWAPKDQIAAIDHALESAGRSSGAQVQSFMEQMVVTGGQPTYFRTNKFTNVYQGIVDSYGVGRYKEINPAVFTIMTFPFLFGIMYGDIGHGTVLTLFAAFLIIRERAFLSSPLNEIFAIIFNGRYLLVLMGLFAIYTGFLYNDFFAMMIGPFGQKSFWIFPNNAQADCDQYYSQWKTVSADNSTQACKRLDGAVYPIGMDPNWQQTEGKLEFVNGVKMKMAVILGVIQMLLGEILSLMNYIYFMDMKHIFFGVIPEIVFLTCTFGYMDLIIFIKWMMNWGKEMAEGHSPPSLLETMTAFFLSPGSVSPDRYLYVSSGFQNAIQIILLLLAVAAVPMLLIPIPVIEYRHHKAEAYAQHDDHHDEEHGGSDHGEHAHGDHAPAEPWDFSEVVIRQIIHTIEYVLGTVSNTASYLRLWALSLAHAELSEVFWDFGIMQILENNTNMIFLTWSGWAGATVGVLLLMESLSAFLHALRLHWVEFNGKFFKGDGVKFTPYNIEELIPRPFMLRYQFENPDAATTSD